MNQKSSLREVPHFVSGALTANSVLKLVRGRIWWRTLLSQIRSYAWIPYWGRHRVAWVGQLPRPVHCR